MFFSSIYSTEIVGIICGLTKFAIACEISLKVLSPICWPTTTPSFFTPKYNVPFPFLFNIEVKEMIPSFNSPVDFLNSISMEQISSYEKVVIDLSNATVNTLDGMKIFMSFFSSGNEELFSIPSGIKSLETYKIKNAEINVGNNKDNGILFMMSSLKLLNSNLKITGLSTIRNEFKTYKILENADYKIYIYNYEFKSRSASSTGSGVLT